MPHICNFSWMILNRMKLYIIMHWIVFIFSIYLLQFYAYNVIHQCSYALGGSHTIGGMEWPTFAFFRQSPVSNDAEFHVTIESIPIQFVPKLTEFGSTKSGKL